MSVVYILAVYHVGILLLEWYKYTLCHFRTRANPRVGRHDILIHAASCGEAMSMRPVLLLKSAVLSIHTPAGYALMTKQGYNCILKPFDTLFSMGVLFFRVRPRIVLIAESDVWPIFMFYAVLLRKKIFFVNYTVKPGRPLRNFIHRLLATAIYVKEPHPDPYYTYLGNLKLLTAPVELPVKSAQPILLIASAGQEEIDLHIAYIKAFPMIKFIYVPRHLDWEATLRTKLDQAEIKYAWNSSAFSRDNVYVCFKHGKLNKLLLESNLCLMGDTFNHIGGHNVLEPVYARNYLLLGPNYKTCADLIHLLPKNAYTIVADLQELIGVTERLLRNNLYRVPHPTELYTQRQEVQKKVNLFIQTISP